MNSDRADLRSHIPSELIDLDAVPLATLRTMDEDIFRPAFRHVVELTERMRVNRDGGEKGGWPAN